MALSQSIATGEFDASGDPICATYWEWAQINIQQLPTQTAQITLLGYASAAAFAANPAAPLMTLQFNFPCSQVPLVDGSGIPLTGSALTAAETQNAILAQFPFSSAYLAANFSAYGIAASQVAAQEWVLQQSPMIGATTVS